MKNCMFVRRALSLTLLAAVALCCRAYDFEILSDEGYSLYFNKTSDSQVEVTYQTYSISDNPSYSGDVVIPPRVSCEGTDYTVTSIGRNAFWSCKSLTSVSLPESDKAIPN